MREIDLGKEQNRALRWKQTENRKWCVLVLILATSAREIEELLAQMKGFKLY